MLFAESACPRGRVGEDKVLLSLLPGLSQGWWKSYVTVTDLTHKWREGGRELYWDRRRQEAKTQFRKNKWVRRESCGERIRWDGFFSSSKVKCDITAEVRHFMINTITCSQCERTRWCACCEVRKNILGMEAADRRLTPHFHAGEKTRICVLLQTSPSLSWTGCFLKCFSEK